MELHGVCKVTGGTHKGKIVYYDDDETSHRRFAICYPRGLDQIRLLIHPRHLERASEKDRKRFWRGNPSKFQLELKALEDKRNEA